MKWSLRVARPAGISVYVHVTFLLLPIWAAFSQYAFRGSWADAAIGVAFILVLFGIVVLHELGHALTARRFGVQTRDIILLPIGGVARLESMPQNPKQELLIALAGPAVNVCLAVLLFALRGLALTAGEGEAFDLLGGGFLTSLMWVNVALAVFNMLPAFPMDGGRVLRALLALKLDYARATRLASGVGQAVALVFGFLGLSSLFFGHAWPVSNPFLLLIALFVWVGARQESAMVQMKSALGGVPISNLLITQFTTLSPLHSLGAAAEKSAAGWQRDFPVLEDGQVVGLLTQAGLVHGLAQRGEFGRVGEVMQREVPLIDPSETAEAAFLRLKTSGVPLLVAARGQEIYGILTPQKVSDFLLVRSALSREALEHKGRFSVHREAA